MGLAVYVHAGSIGGLNTTSMSMVLLLSKAEQEMQVVLSREIVLATERRFVGSLSAVRFCLLPRWSGSLTVVLEVLGTCACPSRR